MPFALRRAVFALLLCLPALPQAAFAGTASGPYARIVTLQPKPGQADAFATGYQRHLGWHRDNRDTWTWYGWTFVLGDRLGQFMDGTFGHALQDFDHAVAPAADAADNAVNVTPHADFRSHGIFMRIEAASRGAPVPDTSPFLALDTYEVWPGQEAAFERAITTQAATGKGRQSWYRLRIGGPATQYLLMRPVTSFAAAGALPDVVLPSGLVQQARSELLRFQVEMSYVP